MFIATSPPTTTSTPFTTTTTSTTTTTASTTTQKPCIPPKVPTSCVPMCEDKCHYLGRCDNVVTMDICLPGCQCPNGTVWNGTTCTERDLCPCRDDNGTVHEVTTAKVM